MILSWGFADLCYGLWCLLFAGVLYATLGFDFGDCFVLFTSLSCVALTFYFVYWLRLFLIWICLGLEHVVLSCCPSFFVCRDY